MKSIKYRKATAADALIDLWWGVQSAHRAYDARFYDDIGEKRSKASWRRHFAELLADKTWRLFVATLSGEPVGLIVAHFGPRSPIFRIKHQAAVETTVVRADCRRRGVFRRLLACVEKAARAEGIETITLDVHHANPAKKAYAKTGFSVHSHSMVKWLMRRRPPTGSRP